jgi:multiple sugar transport system permease protein
MLFWSSGPGTSCFTTKSSSPTPVSSRHPADGTSRGVSANSSTLFVPMLRAAIESSGFAEAHKRIGNLAVLTGGPAHSEGLPVTPQWAQIAALMERNFGPVLAWLAAGDIVGERTDTRSRQGAAQLMTSIDESDVGVTRCRRPSQRHTRAPRRARAGPMFVAPNLAAVAVFMLFPLGFSFYMSFQHWDLFKPAKFVGLANFRSLFTADPLFIIALRNTVVYTVGTIIPTVVISLAVAGMLNRKVRGIGIFRIATVILLAAMQGVPDTLYEAARLDGAGELRQFVSITVPLIRGALSFVVVISIIHAFQTFDLVYVLTGGNGGPEMGTYVLGIMLFQRAFAFLQFGYASALAWVLFAILLVLTVLQLRLTRRRTTVEERSWT